MIDVTEDRDDGASGPLVAAIPRREALLDQLGGGLRLLDLELDVVLHHDLDGLIRLDRGVDGGRRPREEELLDDVRALDARRRRKVLDRDRLRDLDGSRRLLRLVRDATAASMTPLVVLSIATEEPLGVLERLVAFEHVLGPPWLEGLVGPHPTRTAGPPLVAARAPGLPTRIAAATATTPGVAVAISGIRLHHAAGATASAGTGVGHHAAARVG